MPVSDDPNARVLYVLSTDAKKPKDSRPVFVCKPLTRRQSREKRQRLEKAREATTVDAAYDLYLDVIMDGVTDWRNVNGPDGKPIPFTRDNVEDRLSDAELSELARNFEHFDEVDQKN